MSISMTTVYYHRQVYSKVSCETEKAWKAETENREQVIYTESIDTVRMWPVALHIMYNSLSLMLTYY